ncbi:MAG: hypothetical protein ABF665_05285, partial [Gluconacetobacter sp.]
SFVPSRGDSPARRGLMGLFKPAGPVKARLGMVLPVVRCRRDVVARACGREKITARLGGDGAPGYEDGSETG